MAKILLVDDSKDLLEFLTSLLQMKKFEVRIATSKLDIYECIQVFKPDLILMDVLLNGESGRDICKEIKKKKEFTFIPIILISANPDLLRNFAACNADDAIEKPFHIQALLNKIHRHLNERVYI